jgi:hypothetical protein
MPSSRRHADEVIPVAAVTPFPMPFCTSLLQRSPQRLPVAFELSIFANQETSSSTRPVTRPCGSPTRKTVCLSPPLAMVRLILPDSYRSTEICEATTPSTRPQPTMPAMVSSFRQFCSETTKPCGER